MPQQVLIDLDSQAAPIQMLAHGEVADWARGQDLAVQAWLKATGFRAEAGETAWAPLAEPTLLVGIGASVDRWSLAAIPLGARMADYRLLNDLEPGLATEVAIGWALGAYRFDRYRKDPKGAARLVWPPGADRVRVVRECAAVTLVRDLINTPSNDMGPADLALACQDLAQRYGADHRVVLGDGLLAEGYPLIHAVGRASSREPRLIDLTWGDPKAPTVTLVGKGVCFDSGGLDIKSPAHMLEMKKDMGGAAHALALAQMILEAGLPVRLRLLIAAVENAVGGDAFRPLDVIRARGGLTVEIGNTDAEGRLLLADALAEGSSDAPDLLIDFATLTGAARIALGADLPAMFCNDEALAAQFLRITAANDDPVWRMPLWAPYLRDLRGKVADLRNISGGPFAGAIYAAVFMEQFVRPGTSWLHIDTYGWNDRSEPGRPEGGEARNLRSAFDLIVERLCA